MEKIEYTTHHGKECVILPVEYYHRLCEEAEMLEDIRAYDQAKAQQNAGEEYFPADFVDALLDAKNPGGRVALWRKYRNMSQRRLAKEAGINQAYLSEIENHKKPGSAKALKAIAHILRCDLDDLVE